MSLLPMKPERIKELRGHGALLLDLRPFDEYLKGHVPASISLIFESGPGFGGRARDLLPLESKLILIEDQTPNTQDAAAMLRGKGFEVVGYLDSDNTSRLGRTGTLQIDLDEAFDLMLLDVGDPGISRKATTARFISPEDLWVVAGEFDKSSTIGVLAGWGVRAATAIGILESAKLYRLKFVRTRPVGAKPPTAGPESSIFRVGGPG